MSDYGRKKIKTMLKSSLPATNRKEIKSRKDKLHRLNRRKPIVELHKYNGLTETEACEVFEDDDFDYHFWGEPHRCAYGGWDDIVFDRRDHDKLNHFIFWAWKRTRHLPADKREHYLKHLLGPNMLGWHAMQHTMPVIRPFYYGIWRTTDDDGLELPARMVNRGENAKRNKRRQQKALLLEELKVIASDSKKLHSFNEFLLTLSPVITQSCSTMFDVAKTLTQVSNRGYEHVETVAVWQGYAVKYRKPLIQLKGRDDVYRFMSAVTNTNKYGWWTYFHDVLKHLGIE